MFGGKSFGEKVTESKGKSYDAVVRGKDAHIASLEHTLAARDEEIARLKANGSLKGLRRGK